MTQARSFELVNAPGPTEGTPTARRGSSLGHPTASWSPPAVVTACSSALQRLDRRAITTLGVTSCSRGEGRSTIAVGLALVQRYEHSLQTILVELDLDNPSLADRLGLPRGPGVAEALREEAPLDDCIYWLDDKLAVLVAGDVGHGAPELLSRLNGSDVMRQLRLACGVVVADLPPLPPVGLGGHVAGLCSTVLLVVRAGATPLADIRRGVSALNEPPPVLLNGTRSAVPAWLRTMTGG